MAISKRSPPDVAAIDRVKAAVRENDLCLFFSVLFCSASFFSNSLKGTPHQQNQTLPGKVGVSAGSMHQPNEVFKAQCTKLSRRRRGNLRIFLADFFVFAGRF